MVALLKQTRELAWSMHQCTHLPEAHCIRIGRQRPHPWRQDIIPANIKPRVIPSSGQSHHDGIKGEVFFWMRPSISPTQPHLPNLQELVEMWVGIVRRGTIVCCTH